MKVSLTSCSQRFPTEPLVVERKGLGHPDSLADLVAEQFSNLYARETLIRFGRILNHWVDKVVLRGAKATVGFGSANVLEPIRAYLFGRVLPGVGNDVIDVDVLFRLALTDVFRQVFPDTPILDFVQYVVDTNDAMGADHIPELYRPTSREHLSTPPIKAANDTAVAVAFTPLNRLERLVLDIENHINSPSFKEEWKFLGSDVKVLGISVQGELDITICVPFIASRTPSYEFYHDALATLRSRLSAYIAERWDAPYHLYLNTKDREKLGYLTVFGSALDKGDYGVVGRGNRSQDVISLYRPSVAEAVHGKNPFNHTGKLYAELASQVSMNLFSALGAENTVTLVSRNGAPLRDPAHALVQILSEHPVEELRNRVTSEIEEQLQRLDKIRESIFQRDPVAHFRSP